MAQFCKDCIEIELGLYPYDEHYKDWLVKKGDICEGCGYDYLEDKQGVMK